jgi:hypothetical protein
MARASPSDIFLGKIAQTRSAAGTLFVAGYFNPVGGGKFHAGPGPAFDWSGAGAMSAFQAYAGVYEFGGEAFNWRCYATIRVHAVRPREHGPLPKPPLGRKWVWQRPLYHEPDVGWLVDDGAEGFSHILLQIEPQRSPNSLAAAV